MPALYLLFETASGYTLLEVRGLDELGSSSVQVQQAVNDLARFSKVDIQLSSSLAIGFLRCCQETCRRCYRIRRY